MTELVPFIYDAHQIRTLTRDGDPWFVAADVCAVLEISNHRDALASLDDDEKGVATADTPGGDQHVSVVNEPGLYSLILRSRKPEATRFKRWITHEVIPSIRKTGIYNASRSQIDVLRDALDQIEAAQHAAERAEVTATETSARLDAIEGRHEWFAALGYAKLHGIATDHRTLNALGRAASRAGRAHQITPNRVQHALYGEVNHWPRWVWDTAADELGWSEAA